MAKSRAELRAYKREWLKKQRLQPAGFWLTLVEQHLGIPRRKVFRPHILTVLSNSKRGPKPSAPIPIDRGVALRCVMSERRMRHLSFCSSVRRG